MYQISIDESLRRVLQTKKLTRPLRPTFGLNEYIDKNLDIYSQMNLKNEIILQIKLFEPRISEVTSIEFEQNLENLIANIKYRAIDNYQEYTKVELWSIQVL